MKKLSDSRQLRGLRPSSQRGIELAHLFLDWHVDGLFESWDEFVLAAKTTVYLCLYCQQDYRILSMRSEAYTIIRDSLARVELDEPFVDRLVASLGLQISANEIVGIQDMIEGLRPDQTKAAEECMRFFLETNQKCCEILYNDWIEMTGQEDTKILILDRDLDLDLKDWPRGCVFTDIHDFYSGVDLTDYMEWRLYQIGRLALVFKNITVSSMQSAELHKTYNEWQTLKFQHPHDAPPFDA